MTLMIGVSGVRGLVGQTLTPQTVLEFAQAFGTLLNGGRVLLGRDSRPSGPMYAHAAAAGLIAAGCEVVDLGVVMTPAVGYGICSDRRCAGGVVITASHNPQPWNGLKFLDHRGLAPDPEQARRIAALRQSGAWRQLESGFRPPQSDPGAAARHVAAVRAAVEVDSAPLRGMKVVLDSVNGAGGPAAAAWLRDLGCTVVHLNAEPTGQFAHPPEPLAENLGQLCAAVAAHGAAVGFAQDPDGDRLAIVDERGQYIGEEYTLALAAWFVLSRRPGPVAANLSTSRLIDVVAARYGARVVRTPVGEAHVARRVLEERCVIGGEGNGGVIDPRISPVRDSLSAMSLVLQLLASSGRSISQLVGDLPRLAMIKEKAECPRERINAAVESVARAFAAERIDRSDGVRVDFPEGWVHLRASNTEPIVRIVAEAESEPVARSLAQRVRQAAGL